MGEARRARTGGRRPGAGRLVALGLALGLGLAGCTGGDTAPAPGASQPVAAMPSLPPRPVSHETLWLCKPGLPDNPCEGGLDATVIEPDGGREEVPFAPATDPVADCFYVYPTVSESPKRTAPMRVTEAEVRTVRAQAARFAQTCRVFAPIYRQITRAGLASGGLTDVEARDRAYKDVRSAFNDYLNTENKGRPFVLIGHSQGSWQLTRLIQEQIDGDPVLRARMLSALLLGGTLTTAPGQPTRGTFLNVPTCASPEQSGCVVGYSTYAGTPPANGIFGRSSDTQQAMCVNPAALLGRDDLTAYLPTARIMGGPARVADAPETGFVTLPGRVAGTCRTTEDFSWLDVTLDLSGLPGVPQLAADANPAWGLHSADVSLALGDLVDLVAAESAAWSQRGGPSQP